MSDWINYNGYRWWDRPTDQKLYVFDDGLVFAWPMGQQENDRREVLARLEKEHGKPTSFYFYVKWMDVNDTVREMLDQFAPGEFNWDNK